MDTDVIYVECIYIYIYIYIMEIYHGDMLMQV